ncbi:50S ribosomal protein L25/general stress protein Ctc [Oricola thermophila]|uniref:Large ribosomal subunit protein bL25 n=1 Tax=Oricola thermophila TaxID=2742145 RepID=A0A6N1V816_9HYPH|nr:50S ribosomal protein L25/general stress protein Ctc [Oricola thermophila]QKV17106.1 50S ribosomal protein L25/general stress protein Ctc [Oricola thermophila]
MSETYVLKAEARERVGKGSARAIRRNGNIPAVIYGDNKPPLSITLPLNEVTKRIHAGGFMTTVAEIELDGKKHRVLPKAYDLDPVKDIVMHVDFLRVSAKTEVTVNIPVHFLNEETCPGLKKGGTLNVVRHEVEVHCPADAIPDYFELDLADAELGDALKISRIELPKGVVPTITDRDFTIATISAPGGGAKEEAEEVVETEEEAVTAEE